MGAWAPPIVWALPCNTPGRFPKIEAFELPFVPSRRALVSSKALDDYAAKENDKENLGHPALKNATLDDVVANIDHVVKVAGIDHVGIGSDYDGIPDVARGLEDVSKMPYLTAALLKKGYSESDVKKVMGGNFLRVMKEVIGK